MSAGERGRREAAARRGGRAAAAPASAPTHSRIGAVVTGPASAPLVVILRGCEGETCEQQSQTKTAASHCAARPACVALRGYGDRRRAERGTMRGGGTSRTELLIAVIRGSVRRLRDPARCMKRWMDCEGWRSGSDFKCRALRVARKLPAPRIWHQISPPCCATGTLAGPCHRALCITTGASFMCNPLIILCMPGPDICLRRSACGHPPSSPHPHSQTPPAAAPHCEF
jgi:hypothetical protein